MSHRIGILHGLLTGLGFGLVRLYITGVVESECEPGSPVEHEHCQLEERTCSQRMRSVNIGCCPEQRKTRCEVFGVRAAITSTIMMGLLALGVLMSQNWPPGKKEFWTLLVCASPRCCQVPGGRFAKCTGRCHSF